MKAPRAAGDIAVAPTRRRQRLLMEAWRLSRPAIWFTCLLPYALGYLLATTRLWPHDPAPFFAGAIVMGPLSWLMIFCANDVNDVRGDQRNARLAGGPVPSGRVSTRTVATIGVVSATVAVGVAAFVGLGFAALTVLFLALGVVYSVPPLRLKTRPGADVAVNAIALGAVVPVGGWLVARPIDGFPWVMAVQGILVGAAIYIPTTVLDYESDRASGFTTFAVRLGPRLTYRIALAFWLVANAVPIALAATGTVFPHRMLSVLVVCAPVLVVAYHIGIGRARTQRHMLIGLITVMCLFMVPMTVFALMFTGTV